MEQLVTKFKETTPEHLADNLIKLIGQDWMLITAGSADKFNTMTASWGTMGVLWNLPVAVCFVRPTRYTWKFMEESSFFTLSFFDRSHKDILNFCGSRSGSKVDKIKATGLTPMLTKNQAIGFAQSRISIECRKIYFDDLKPANFLLPDISKDNYPKKDFHRMYIGEMTGVYSK